MIPRRLKEGTRLRSWHVSHASEKETGERYEKFKSERNGNSVSAQKENAANKSSCESPRGEFVNVFNWETPCVRGEKKMWRKDARNKRDKENKPNEVKGNNARLTILYKNKNNKTRRYLGFLFSCPLPLWRTNLHYGDFRGC